MKSSMIQFFLSKSGEVFKIIGDSKRKKEMGKERSKKIIHYDCDKPGYKRTECPNKKRNVKKNELQTTQDESDDDDQDENESQEEVINMCFMVIENEI